MSKEITVEEVGKHSGENSVWMIIHNDVYDVTKFLAEHPGGADSLLEYAGKDGTQAFEDVAHSDDARQLMKKFKIGSIPPGQQTQPGNCTNCERNNPLHDSKHETRTARDTRPYCTDQSSSNAAVAGVPDKLSRSFTGTERRSEVIGRRLSSSTSPRERIPRGLPCESKLKMAVVALAGAVIIGLILKKYMT